MLRLITPPATDPISSTQLSQFLRLNEQEALDQAEVLSMIPKAVTGRCQRETGLQLLTATYDLFVTRLEERIVLPLPPLQTVVEVSYLDANAARVPVPFTFSADDVLGLVYINYADLPDTSLYHPQFERAAVIRFTCGYSNADQIPTELTSGMLQHAATLYAHREEVVAGVAVNLLPLSTSYIYQMYDKTPIYTRMSKGV